MIIIILHGLLFLVEQGEYAVQLEISEAQEIDRGSYKLIAKNAKGEITSQAVEVKNIPAAEVEKKKAKPEEAKVSFRHST